MVLGHIDNEVELVGGNHVHHVVLTIFVRPADRRCLHPVLVEELGCAVCSVDVETLLDKLLCGFQQSNLTLGCTRRDEH